MSGQPVEETESAFLHRGRKRVALAVLVVALLAAAWPVARWFYAQAVVAHEDAAADVPLYTAAEVTRAGIDFGIVHAELLPEWFAALGRRERDPAAELVARQALLDAVGPDTVLTELIAELGTARDASDLDGALIREQQLIDEWNARLRDDGIPFSVQLPLNGRQRAAGLWALSYFVLGDVALRAGERAIPSLLLTRVDDLGVVEGYAGHAAENGEAAFVLVDRVAELAANRLWPLLAPELDHRLPAFHRAFAEAVRAELEAGLPADVLATLRETAAARGDLVWTRESINGRRDCGSWFSLRWVPMRGFSREDLEEWRSVASSAGTGICPAITYGELDVLRDASWTIAHTAGVRDAVHTLSAFAARAVAIHEARHVLDFDATLTCSECPSWASESVLLETSAFLASLAWGDAPAVAAFELCELVNESSSMTYRRAAWLITERVLPDGCEGGPPDDLRERAAALEEALFGRSDRIELPEGFPERLRSRRFP